ncbi:hypothetical protein BDV96DRAFT_311431 [Lophiotrema nucula]|uniref:Zn(2)-C6 fungal-type domain-containing protein n=1 Tax=Lophiotrema nucula TaxID=690887 RepID=A0A6A5YI85_9PLEO|nr:hypothetical protein BDV96DRAFT_311431 [Lophiotrema nucula]
MAKGSYIRIHIMDDPHAQHGTPPASSKAINQSPAPDTTTGPRMRKRTKTGCLTCRKRRIKCGEERPTCANCIKSKRQCEGYNQRVTFKPPKGDWPNHPGVISTLQYHNALPIGSGPSPHNQAHNFLNAGSNAIARRPLASFDYGAPDHTPLHDTEPFRSTGIQQSCSIEAHMDYQYHNRTIFQPVSDGAGQYHGRSQLATLPLFGTRLSSPVTTFPQHDTVDVKKRSFTSQPPEMALNSFPGTKKVIPEVRKEIHVHKAGVQKESASAPQRELPEQVTSPSHGSIHSSGFESEVDECGTIPSTKRRRDEVVNRVMSYFLSLLHAKIVTHGCGSEATTGSPVGRTHSSNSNATASNFDKLKKTSLGKHPSHNDDDEFSDEDAHSKRQRVYDHPLEGEPNKRKFACPYFQRNSERYVMRRSCVGPGWDEVRRVKEHLYRNHRLPVFCPRCYETFSVDALLHVYQRADEPCAKRPEEAIEGFDSVQERSLKSRKKPKSELTEEDKWKDMYRILFPDDDDSLMPSPYLASNWEQIYQKGRVSGSNEIARYEQFLRRELPTAVRRELEVAVDEEYTPMEERLKSRLIEIVRDVQLQLFRSYTRSRTTVKGRETYEAADTTHSDSAPTLQTVPDSVQPSLLNELASFEPIPPFENTDTGDFDAILFQFDDLEDFNDSAYGSLFDTGLAKPGWENGSRYFIDPNSDNGEGSSRSAS